MTVAQRSMKASISARGTVGLITYMRTDSVTLAEEALRELRDVIATRYGKDNAARRAAPLPTKSKNAQEAHEAIRPTSASRAPDDVRAYSTRPVQALRADLEAHGRHRRWSRPFYDTVALDLVAGESTAQHRVPRDRLGARDARLHRGIHRKGSTTRSRTTTQDHILPPLDDGDRLSLRTSSARSTSPSRRRATRKRRSSRRSRSSASAARRRMRHHLDAASTANTSRWTTAGSSRRTSAASSNRFLTQFFSQYVDYEFTARMEDDLDAVSRGEAEWVPLLEEFWKPFKQARRAHREQRHARAGVAGASARHRSRERAAGERADGPLRRVRADRHEGRRRQAEVRGPASRPEDGHDHARRCARSVQAAARARVDAGRRARVREHRPLRPYVKR